MESQTSALTTVITAYICCSSVAGMPIPGEVNVGMAIFVLPFNAALNPFLYTFKMLQQRLQAMDEKRLAKFLRARIKA